MRAALRLAPAILLAASGAFAGEVTVAVAANAAEAVEALAADFEQRTGHRVTLTVGSTGKLYAQILHGAPFDVFLAADQERPRLLVEQGLAVDESRHTYAVGRLALWGPDPTVEASVETLRAGSFRRLAIANPDLAPYGAAARETLQELGLWKSLRGKIAFGENVGQAFAMIASGNAELGFTALSSVLSPRNVRSGSLWEVPANLHAPVRQDSVLLERGQGKAAARDFYLFLGSPGAREVVESFGFIVDRAVGPLDDSQPGERPGAPAQGPVGKRRPGQFINR
ncbi:MAG: molybdate ABC transporter substrate-binding protein [Acidobacteria bacterium]|nr:molybdate ABC transporter substrate-binding protein [Acidobacteriota bacterium]